VPLVYDPQVHASLEILNKKQSVFGIANYLVERQCFARAKNPRKISSNCPIAVYLEKECPPNEGQSYTVNRHLITRGNQPVASVPDYVYEFIIQFDAGRFPQLRAKARSKMKEEVGV
jgi:hypothetical protein